MVGLDEDEQQRSLNLNVLSINSLLVVIPTVTVVDMTGDYVLNTEANVVKASNRCNCYENSSPNFSCHTHTH